MNEITLHHVNGDVWTYESLEDVYNTLGYRFIINKIGFQFNYCNSEDFILRDNSGKEITYKDFDYILEREYKIRENILNGKSIIRGTGPIPGTKKRRGRYRIIKRPRSMNEKKNVSKCLLEAYDNDINIKLRAKRNIVNLPDAYNDINRSDVDDRSWKSNKRNKYQWK